MIAIAIVVVLRVILFTMQWFASVVMFSVTADKLRGFSEEDKLAVPGLSTNCAMGPTSTCTGMFSFASPFSSLFGSKT